jgi:CBS-domain-containing membrane protein
MSEEVKQDQVQEQGQATEEKNDVSTGTQDLMAIVQQLQETVDLQKKEISGLNRRNSEEQARLKALQEKHMSEDELKASKMQELEHALVSQYTETQLLKNGVPAELAGLIRGRDKSEIDANVATLVAFREKIEGSNLKEKNEMMEELKSLRLKVNTTGVPTGGDSQQVDMTNLSIDEKTRLFREEK